MDIPKPKISKEAVGHIRRVKILRDKLWQLAQKTAFHDMDHRRLHRLCREIKLLLTLRDLVTYFDAFYLFTLYKNPDTRIAARGLYRMAESLYPKSLYEDRHVEVYAFETFPFFKTLFPLRNKIESVRYWSERSLYSTTAPDKRLAVEKVREAYL